MYSRHLSQEKHQEADALEGFQLIQRFHKRFSKEKKNSKLEFCTKRQSISNNETHIRLGTITKSSPSPKCPLQWKASAKTQIKRKNSKKI